MSPRRLKDIDLPVSLSYQGEDGYPFELDMTANGFLDILGQVALNNRACLPSRFSMCLAGIPLGLEPGTDPAYGHMRRPHRMSAPPLSPGKGSTAVHCGC